ncbi:MAG: DUF4291 domain-containing protein [Planctomycetes bacterium]|nr:DUF4291 domain-containing protein [Planctomycetota bacterium]
MQLDWKPYADVCGRWPAAGRHILASYDAEEIVVYQAYRPEIADHAVQHQRFGGPFSLNRMSWIKPNFLWMMHRCGWAGKPDQQRVLAIHLRMQAFIGILGSAVWSSFQPGLHASPEAWSAAVDGSDIRLQWDPDHDPAGRAQPRRAVQLGMRGQALRSYAQDWLTRIEDITAQVHAQAGRRGDPRALLVPDERPLTLVDPALRTTLKLDLP